MKELLAMDVALWHVKNERWAKRRMLCRLEHLLLGCWYWGAEYVISSEADEMFLGDPFKFFQDRFDIGLAWRGPDAKIPVNAGLIFLRNTTRVRRFLAWAVGQIKRPTWSKYCDLRHRKNTHDVYCDRDLWWAAWRDRHFLDRKFAIKIALVDAGYLMGDGKRSFHLKGQSKKQIYTDRFKEIMYEAANRATVS